MRESEALHFSLKASIERLTVAIDRLGKTLERIEQRYSKNV